MGFIYDMNDCCAKVINEMGGKSVFFTTDIEYTDKNNSTKSLVSRAILR